MQSTGRDTQVSERAVAVHKRWLSALRSSKSQTCQGLFTATSLSSIPENCKLILPGLTPHTARSADSKRGGIPAQLFFFFDHKTLALIWENISAGWERTCPKPTGTRGLWTLPLKRQDGNKYHSCYALWSGHRVYHSSRVTYLISCSNKDYQVLNSITIHIWDH